MKDVNRAVLVECVGKPVATGTCLAGMTVSDVVRLLPDCVPSHYRVRVTSAGRVVKRVGYDHRLEPGDTLEILLSRGHTLERSKLLSSGTASEPVPATA